MKYLPLVKGLVLAYQAFESHSAIHIKEMGLTATQFDILATLGNQPPMTCKELGEKTLVLKGTMTGVLERLEAKGLIEKFINQEDGRSYMIGLTKAGEKMLQCDKCHEWFHQSCLRITDAVFESFADPNTPFNCPKCHCSNNHNVSDQQLSDD